MDNNRKVRFGVIAENHANIDYNTNPNNHTLFIDSDNHLAVKKDNAGKSWNIKDSIKNNLREEYAQNPQGVKQIYGFKLNMNESDPMSAIEYIHDNTAYTPISFTDLRSACDYGSWSDFIYNFIGCRPVALYEDGTVYRYLNENDYTKDVDGNDISIELGSNIDPTGKIYNIMVEFSQKWYHIYSDDNGYLYFEIANYKVNNDWCTDAFLGPDGNPKEYLYISAYFTQEYYLGGRNLYSSCKYKESYMVNNGRNSNGWCNGNYTTFEEILEEQNKYVFGYSQYIYFNMLMTLLCKTTLIKSPYGIMDPLNNGPYSIEPIRIDKDVYNNPESNFQNTDTSKRGLFYIDKDVDDVYKNSSGNTLTCYEEKILGVDNLLSGSVILYGLAYAKNDLFYKPNPPYYFPNNINNDLYNKTTKYYFEHDHINEFTGNYDGVFIDRFKAINNILLMGDNPIIVQPFTYINSSFRFYYINQSDYIGSSSIGDELNYPFSNWYTNTVMNQFIGMHFMRNKQPNVDYKTNTDVLHRFIQFSN